MHFTIKSYIKFISRKNLLLPGIIALVIAILLIVLPLKNEFNPPKVSSIDEINATVNKNIGYVDFNMSNLHYSNYDYYTKNPKKSACYYYVLDEGESPKCTFFLIPLEYTNNKAEVLDTLCAKAKVVKKDARFKNFINAFSSDVGWNASDMEKISGNFVVSQYDYHPTLTIIITILLFILLAISILYFVANLIFMISPRLHPACKRLRTFGLSGRDFKEIDIELANNRLIHAGNIYLTENYLVILGNRNLWLVPLYNIVWVYQYAIWNPFVKKNKLNYRCTIVTSPKSYVRVNGTKKSDNDKIFGYLKENFSHIAVGYSDEIKEKMETLI